MYRAAIESLYRWKKSRHRKPLIIEGPRQVGKTWLMKEFGSNAYTDTVYINFDSNSRMAELFLPIWIPTVSSWDLSYTAAGKSIRQTPY